MLVCLGLGTGLGPGCMTVGSTGEVTLGNFSGGDNSFCVVVGVSSSGIRDLKAPTAETTPKIFRHRIKTKHLEAFTCRAGNYTKIASISLVNWGLHQRERVCSWNQILS